jgi:molecular chaperone GrpE
MATKRNTDQEQDEDENQAGSLGNHAPMENDAPGAAQAADRRLQELASQLEESRARHLRLAADFENYKKRARQEQVDTVQYAAAALAERLLPVLDDVERALDHAPEGADEGWLRGVRLTFQHLEEALASVGVEPIETVGRPFDPKLDEAIGSEESDEHPDDTVLVELRRGYRMHDRVLRPALVKVSRRPAQDS